MFICEKCLKPEDIHSILPMSRGPCEICHIVSDCYEVSIHANLKKEEWLSEPAITRHGCHDWVAILKAELTLNPSADWMREMIDTLSYICSCTECRRRLRKGENPVDTEMMDKIFHINGK
jgi:hypothetical protein